MANYRKNLLNKMVAKSTATNVEKLLGETAKVEVNHPQVKLSKRMAKKLASTGRTSTSQPITKEAKLNAKIAAIKATPRPTIPGKKAKKLPKVTAPRPTLPKMPDKTEDPILEQDLQDMQDQALFDEMKAKQFLTDMITARAEDMPKEWIDKIKDKIYSSDMQTVENLIEYFGGAEELLEYYKDSGYDDSKYKFYKSKAEREAVLKIVMMELGIQY